MTTSILSALGIPSWDSASAWASSRAFPCEECTDYDAAGKCKLYQLCKANGAQLGAAFFTRSARPYRPDPRRGSVQG